MWPFNQLTESAQIAILTAFLTLLSSLAGYTYRGWLDKREYDRRRKVELELERQKERMKDSLVRTATIKEIEIIKSGSGKMTREENSQRQTTVMDVSLPLLLIILLAGISSLSSRMDALQDPRQVILIYILLFIILPLAFILGMRIPRKHRS